MSPLRWRRSWAVSEENTDTGGEGGQSLGDTVGRLCPEPVHGTGQMSSLFSPSVDTGHALVRLQG